MSDKIHADGTVLTELNWRPGGARGGDCDPELTHERLCLFAVLAVSDEGEWWDVQQVWVDYRDLDQIRYRTPNGRYEWEWADVEWYVPVDEMDLPR